MAATASGNCYICGVELGKAAINIEPFSATQTEPFLTGHFEFIDGISIYSK